MSLIVYGVPLSPFVRKLRLCLNEKGLDYQLEIIVPHDRPDWFYDISPLGRIPALRDGELTLADSSVICQYLEERNPERRPLFGRNPSETAQIRWLEKYADYELASQCTFTVFRNRLLKPTLGQVCDEERVQAALRETLPGHFDYLERTLDGDNYFVGNELTQADLAIYSQLQNMEHGGESLDANRWPELAAHYARIRARESVQAVLPGELKIIARMTGQR